MGYFVPKCRAFGRSAPVVPGLGPGWTSCHLLVYPVVPPICTLSGFQCLSMKQGVCWPGPGGLGACDSCPPQWVIEGFTRPSGRPTRFPQGEIMHLKAAESAQLCGLNGPLVLQNPVVSARLSGRRLCWLLLPGQRPCQRPGKGGESGAAQA